VTLLALLACAEPEQAAPTAAPVPTVQVDLADLTVLSNEVEDRSGIQMRRIHVQAGPDAKAEAEALVATLPPASEAYVTSANDLDVDVRVYSGKNLTHHLTFTPSLDQPERRRGLDRPWVALVVSGLGQNAQAAQTLLEVRMPITLAVTPFSPFSLLHARDAALHHKELLVELAPDHSPEDALAAVPRSSGLLLQQPIDLGNAELGQVYLLDASGGDGLRRPADVPLLAVTEHIEGDVTPHTVRIENLADRNGSVVLLVDVDDPEAVTSTVEWLYGNQTHLRPVFVSEVLWLPENGPD